MSSGRTIWQAQDTDWWSRERVVDLGEEFGPAGPAVANWLECAAKKQHAGGIVKAGYKALARGTFLPGGPAEAERIVRYAVEIGFLKDFDEGTRTFVARVSAFKEDQARGRDTLTKSDRRTGGDDPGQPRTTPDTTAQSQEPPRTTPDNPGQPRTCPAPVGTGEESREEERTEENDLESSTPVEPDRLDAARERAGIAQRVFAYWQQQCNHPTARFTRDRRAKIEARLREGYSEAQLCTAIDGAARAAFVNDQGKRFDDLELICRNGSKLEQFIARAAPQPPGVKFNAPRSGRWSATDFMEYGAELATEGDAA